MHGSLVVCSPDGAQLPAETTDPSDAHEQSSRCEVSAASRKVTVADGLKLHHVRPKDGKLVHGFLLCARH